MKNTVLFCGLGYALTQRLRFVPPGNLSQQLAARLRFLRAEQDLTQERAAALIGCDYKHYQRIEAGLKDVRLSTLERIAKAFGVGVEELLEHSSRESRQGSG